MATQAGKANWFAIWVSAGVVALLVVVLVAVVWMNNQASAPAARPDSAGINQTSGAVEVGGGDSAVDIYFDFYCPHCQEFESVYGDTLTDELEAGSITLNLHPVALSGLNAASGTDFSKRASNAMYCVAAAEPTAAYPFYTSLFAQNPSGEGLTDAELIGLAESAGATGIDSCVSDREWDDLVSEQTQSIPANPDTGDAGTPTVLVNDEYLTLTGDPAADITARIG